MKSKRIRSTQWLWEVQSLLQKYPVERDRYGLLFLKRRRHGGAMYQLIHPVKRVRGQRGIQKEIGTKTSILPIYSSYCKRRRKRWEPSFQWLRRWSWMKKVVVKVMMKKKRSEVLVLMRIAGCMNVG